ncbi:MAG: glycosyltransferase [Gammaproteobacteria bacterium]|nr:glycosyltransferase [Gammaproteobacteria bacterium]
MAEKQPDQKPRILQICHDYKGPFRTVARQYAGSFSDCEVKTFFLRGAPSSELASSIHGDVEFLTLPSGSLRGLKLRPYRRVKEMIVDDPPDVIVAHRYKPFFVALLLNYRLKIGAVIGVMHEFGFLGRVLRSFFSRFWKDNVQLIGVSQPVCQALLERAPHLQSRVHLLPHAIEVVTHCDPVSARHELGIPLGSYCYGTVGRLVRKKDHKLLIEAFAGVHDDSVLAFVGDGGLMPELKMLAKKLGVQDRVIFCGAKDEARTLMKAFDAFVLPSTSEEAFGIVLLEAMAAQVPIVCSDAPGPVSVIGDTGLLFECGSIRDLTRQLEAVRALTKLNSDEMTQRALDRLGAKFSVPSMARKMRGLPQIEQYAPVTH